jgi:hypothetical protein
MDQLPEMRVDVIDPASCEVLDTDVGRASSFFVAIVSGPHVNLVVFTDRPPEGTPTFLPVSSKC